MMLLPMPGAERLGSIARDLQAGTGSVALHRFPDGEVRLRLAGAVSGQDVVLAAFLDRPDDKVLPLLFAAETARDLGATSVGLVAPYLPYMRQDRRFHPGEAISARYFAAILSRAVDWVVTVDPHLHRVSSLGDVFSVPADVAHAAPLLAKWIRWHIAAPVVLGPDVESAQWVTTVARLADAPQAVFGKCRTGDRRVEVTLPDLTAYVGRQPVLVDDVISSGVTMAAAVRALRSAGWPAPVCLAVHAVFAAGAYEALWEAGAGTVITCNSVPHSTNAIDVDGLLSGAVSRRLADRCAIQATA